ncbi:MAG: vitamin K epoxide reductase family protein [Alphaproteobacteria bacterium]
MQERPAVLVTGAAGAIGTALGAALADRYRVIGMDLETEGAAFETIRADLTSEESVREAIAELRRRVGDRLASVVHLAAYFDFTGEDHPLYRTLNVEGTRRLLQALQPMRIEQFVYAGTMLVHAPCRPGERIDEDQPINPRWAYPRSKAAAETAIRESRGAIPVVLLHLAGVYDETTQIPTLAHQIARIYERDLQSHLYSGDPLVGQSVLHRDDMVDAFRRAIDRRGELPAEVTILVGEPEAVGYDRIQDALGRLIHGRDDWSTTEVPKGIARVGAWAQQKLEPIVPDALDQGEAPFIRPFMVAMADDHYALDITSARTMLGWEPLHDLMTTLPAIVERLKADPLAWYEANDVTPPDWLRTAERRGLDPEALRARHDRRDRGAHAASRWAHFANIGLGTWLLTSPPLIGLQDAALAWSDALSGLALIGCATLALSRGLWAARWASAAIGLWLLAAPVLFWAPTAQGYLNDTLVGTLVIAFAVGTRPEPGVSPLAAATGPTVPPGWSYNPSDWVQRLPIIALALIGLYVSRYLAAYQLGHIDGVWEPFFAGGPAPTNGTEEIITSSVSEAWPVSDAAVGAFTYVLEIITGVIGSRQRWRTMPWLVLLFGLLIVPLGGVSILFIVIQPIVIGTWCTLCLIAAAAMLIQIPYSLDEVLATVQFLRRRQRAGRSLLRVLLQGDTDEGEAPALPDEFDRSAPTIVRDAIGGGVNLPWSLGLAALLGVWLMLTRLTLGSDGGMANVDHLVGAMVLTIVAIAAAEVARPARFLLVPCGLALIVAPFAYGPGLAAAGAGIVCGLALIALSIPRGPVRCRYGRWNAVLA